MQQATHSRPSAGSLQNPNTPHTKTPHLKVRDASIEVVSFLTQHLIKWQRVGGFQQATSAPGHSTAANIYTDT
jgi:hypothetical protein